MWVWFGKDSINNDVSWVLMLVYFWELIKEVFLKMNNFFIRQEHIKLMKVTVNTFIMLQNISISNKVCSF